MVKRQDRKQVNTLSQWVYGSMNSNHASLIKLTVTDPCTLPSLNVNYNAYYDSPSFVSDICMMMSFESLQPFAMSTMKVTRTGTMGTAGKRKIGMQLLSPHRSEK